jgi:predicted nucleic acid-binding protein
LSVYADTSFLASLYVLDANSALAAAHMKRAQLPLLITSLGELELTNAISLRLFRKELPSAMVKAAHALVRKDVRDGVVLIRALPSTAYERAKQIARKRTPRLGTRTLDLLHVASALLLEAGSLWTFDSRQAKLAAAEGLRVL